MTNLLDYIRFDEQHFPAAPGLSHRHAQRVAAGYDRMRDLSVMLVGLARNVESVLPATMLRLELLGRTFRDYRILIYENDSSDRTAAILGAWSNANPRVEVISESLGAPPSRPIRCSSRADRMAFYRSKCQDEVRARHADYDVVGIVDTDLEGGWSPEGVASTFGFDNWDFVGANGVIYKRRGWNANSTAHYDAWAFRTDTRYEPLSTKYVNGLSFQRGEELIPLASCFGGLGFYRMEAYLAGQYEGGDIEHVSFHRSMRASGFGRTFLNPSQIVVYGRKHRRFDRCIHAAHDLAFSLWLARRVPWRFDIPRDFRGFEPHFVSSPFRHEPTSKVANSQAA